MPGASGDGEDPRTARDQTESADALANVPRRTFVGLALVCGGSVAATVAIPATRLVLAPLRAPAPQAQRIAVGKLDDFPIGTPTKLALVTEETDGYTVMPPHRVGAVWLLRDEHRGVRAMSATCPHLGCAIERRDAGGFACPCHQSAFDEHGAHMDPLDVVVDPDGTVHVAFVRYQSGIVARRVVG
jgi:menaquinol-cytochrome c reductase iron-sulfur subunit